MRELLTLPNLMEAADKPPPKETAQRAGLKTNSTEPFQHVFAQSRKMVQRPELKPGSKVCADDTEETAQSPRVENAPAQTNPAAQPEPVTVPVNNPVNSSIQPNKGSDGKEGDKDEKIAIDNKTSNQNQDGVLIILADAKIILTDGVNPGVNVKGMEENEDKQNVPAPPLINVNDKQVIQATNHSVDIPAQMVVEIENKEKVSSSEAKKTQGYSSNMGTNSVVATFQLEEKNSGKINLTSVPEDEANQDQNIAGSVVATLQPEEKNSGKINLTSIPEDKANQHQNIAGASKGGNPQEKSINPQGEVAKPEITSQPQSAQSSQTPLQNGDFHTAVNPKLNNIPDVVTKNIEQGKSPVLQTNGSAPFEESIAGKGTGKAKEDAPPDNIQAGMPQPVLPQNKTSEPARLAEAPRNEIIQQLSKDLESFAKSGQQSLRLQLHPESLGKIDLHLTSNEEGVRIVMNADQAATGFMLERHLGELKEMLERAGVNLTGLSVNSGNAQTHSNENFQNSPFHSTGFSSKINPLNPNQEKKGVSTQWKMDHDSRVDYRI